MGECVTIYCPNTLRACWPTPLARHWQTTYPQVFSKDDLRYTLHFTGASAKARRYHFAEWFGAVHIFNTTGRNILVKRYTFSDHLWKRDIIKEFLGVTGFEFLKKLEGQPPDFFVYGATRSECWFAEVKSPTDRLRPSQRRNHELIERRLGVRVDLVELRYTDNTRHH